MDPLLLLAGTTVAVALLFAFTNGFHDASNAIATSVSTRALTPRVAVALAAVCNFVGAWLGTGIAVTITDVVDVAPGAPGIGVVLAGLLGAIGWNLITWWRGLPTSSSHALLGALAGAGVVAGATTHPEMLLEQVLLPLLVSPLLGFVLAYAGMVGVLWLHRRSAPTPVHRRFRLAQTVSAAAMALGHGLQGAQRAMAAVVLVLIALDVQGEGDGVPLWVQGASALAISLGTYAGGWRIVRTLGRRIIDLDPPRGFVAETVAAGLSYVAAFGLSAPISTTQAVSASIAGAGATRRLSAVRWGVVRSLVLAWVLTFPGAALLAVLAWLALRPLL
ncbi:inorganic phosphate transporter [Kineococcus sp. SYSU DK004]|uniref:inorganic phosphate transporter n=1 Tax=Kineococcus sp. SYSU DK004 TaxID=3383125 RepID=UPI003D7DA6A9